MGKSIRVLVVGDRSASPEGCCVARVGKTSIISTFVSDTFPQNVDPVLCEVVIPTEIAANYSSLVIVDSSCALLTELIML